MESEKNSLRFIIADQEDHLNWTSINELASVRETLVYLSEQQRKKFSSNNLVYKNIEDTVLSLDDLISTGNSPIFVTVQDHSDIITDKDVGPRSSCNIYEFKDADTVRIQRLENMKKQEEVTMKVSILKILNSSSKGKSYNSQQAKETAKLKNDILKEGGFSLNNPLNFVSTEQAGGIQNQNDQEDLTKRQKVPVEDGKSQYSFFKLADNKSQIPAKVESRAYTLDEVKKHRSRQDAWIIIDNKIYDITQYIPFHPGGDKILMGVGKDGTELFNKYHAWVNAHFMLAKFQVGYLKK